MIENNKDIVYLDNNATTRTSSEVVQSMHEYWSNSFLNPGSVAGTLFDADKPLRDAQLWFSNLFDSFDSGRFIITSGATEANNWSLFSIFRDTAPSDHLIISNIEHPSIMEPALELERRGVRVSIVPVNKQGTVDLDALTKEVSKETKLVSVMMANNETGVIQPVASIANIVRSISPSCVIHSDVTQAVGKIPVNLKKDLRDVDLISLSAHKFHGPKGIGALFIRNGVTLPPLLYGGGQQDGLRPGTESPALAAGMAKAAELAYCSSSLEVQEKITSLRDFYERSLLELFPNATVVGINAPRLRPYQVRLGR